MSRNPPANSEEQPLPSADEAIYRRLAQRLDAIPNGFPPTASGVELRLLAKLFTPREARIAAAMRLTPESSSDIGSRVGLEGRSAYRTLKAMARKGLIVAGRGEERQLMFGLMPFIVGFYETQLPRMDAELATLFEEYMQETQGSTVRFEPSVHRVIPVERAIPTTIRVLPHYRAGDILRSAKAWGVRDCICRVQQRLHGAGCDHPIETCLTLSDVPGAFDHSAVDRALSLAEALAILHDAEDAGLVHTVGNFREGLDYICNCCACCCGILRGMVEFGIPTAIASSSLVATVQSGDCLGCAACLTRCPSGALAIKGPIAEVDMERCIGCGLCVTACQTGALSMVDQPEMDKRTPPQDRMEWLRQRATARRLDLDDIL